MAKTLNLHGNFIMKSSKYFYENNNRRHSLVPYATTAVHSYIKSFSNMAIERSLSSKVLGVQTSEPDSHPYPNLIIRRKPPTATATPDPLQENQSQPQTHKDLVRM